MRKEMLLLLLIALASPAAAQTAPSEHRLSPEEVNNILDQAAMKREAAEVETSTSKHPVHGEVGVTVGTGGYRAAYGTAVVGLADDAFASFSFQTGRSREWGWIEP